MNKFWHLVKFNLIFNRVSIAFLSVLSFVILFLCSYFYETQKELGEALMQYTFYVMFMIFTGKMNAKNSMMFDIKQLLAMPLTKTETVLLRAFTDTIQLFPTAAVFLYGFNLAFPTYHLAFISILLILVLAVGNMIAFNKRIDFSRMQHSKASFKNSFLFLHKYLEMIIQLILVIIAGGVVFTLFEKDVFMLEYGFLILIIVGLFVTASNTLKMLKDETRSYFVFKRDIVRIGSKLIIVIVPLMLFHKVYKSDEGLKAFGIEKNSFTTSLMEKAKYIENAGNKRFLLTIIQNDKKAFHKYLKEGNSIPWDADLMGGYAPHLATASTDLDILKQLIKLRPDAVNLAGKYKQKTPLFSAIRNCNLKVVEFLIEKGANINHQDINGDTAAIFAAKRNCYGGILVLNQHGANMKLTNLKGHNIANFIGKKSGMAFILLKKQIQNRSIATEVK